MTQDEPLTAFFNRYYADDVAELAQNYPKDQRSLWVDYADLFAFDAEFANRLRTEHDTVIQELENALAEVSLPIDIDLSAANVRVENLPDEYTYRPGEIRKDQATQFLSIRGQLDRVTTTSDMPTEICFICIRCETVTYVPQFPSQDDVQEPAQCSGCDRDGPYRIDDERSTWADYAKFRIESRPDTGEGASGKIVGYAMDDLIDVGGDSGLLGRAGEPVVVNGHIKRVQKTGRGENNLLFDHIIAANSVEFERDENTVDVEAHREEYEELAARDDAVDLFADSIAPNLYTTDAWAAGMEFAVAYLFGSPRIDIPNGPTYRGDLHFLIVSDFGQGKSDFSSDIEAYSPKCISKSTTALSSGVGLTAAAVEDDFGDGAWTIKPGLLVRANGGHLILDEIDKGPDELTDMNDAIEGKQQVDVEKAGKSVTYNSRTAILALGNPVEGRFDVREPISEQLGIADSLLSRFDGIITMDDQADVEEDKAVAQAFGKAYTEAQEAEYGDREDFEALDRQVPVDVGQAWIKYARENVNPLLTEAQFRELEDWYAEEVRQLNNTFAAGGEGEDMPVPATVRDLAATAKMAIAFARCRLQDGVREPQIERAKDLGKQLVKQHWTGESFDVSKEMSIETQEERFEAVQATVGAEPKSVSEVAEETGLPESKAETTVQRLMDKGELYEPNTGEYLKT